METIYERDTNQNQNDDRNKLQVENNDANDSGSSGNENGDLMEPLMADGGTGEPMEKSPQSALDAPLILTSPGGDGDDIVTCEDDEDDGLQDHVDVDRATWGGQLEFILTCVGYAVGLGNVWRFPYLCYKNGGGAFLIPYVTMLAVVGLPLFFMELAFGQFASLGPITIWRINPLMKGLGYAMVFVSWLIGLYYNVVIAHVVFYLFASMTSELPWTTCGNSWNTDMCISSHANGNESASGAGVPAHHRGVNASAGGTKTPSEEYYTNYVLEQSANMDEFGAPSWKLTLCLLFSWLLVFFVLLKGIQTLGKVVYFTAIFPYVMLTILLIRGVTLPGAGMGIVYYLKPDFSRLSDARVWCDAATQIFYSLSACSGGLIAMSSYSKFTNNCYRDSILVAVINCSTSLYAGFVIFSILGFMAYEKGVDVSHVAAGGPGLTFVVYPEALAKMPVSPLWAVCFFFMMATLGFGSQFSIVECVISAFADELRVILIGTRRKLIFRVAVIGIMFLLGIPMVCKGGIYLLALVDFSVSGFPLLVVGLLECVTINWVYGFKNFAFDIEMMLGHEPNIYWRACWTVVTPGVITTTLIFNVVQFRAAELDGYVLPDWAQSMGWAIVLWPVLTIPALFLLEFCARGGFEALRNASRPERGWGPAKMENRRDTKYDPRFDYGDADDGTSFIASRATIASTMSKDGLCVSSWRADGSFKAGPYLNAHRGGGGLTASAHSLTTFCKSSDVGR